MSSAQLVEFVQPFQDQFDLAGESLCLSTSLSTGNEYVKQEYSANSELKSDTAVKVTAKDLETARNSQDYGDGTFLPDPTPPDNPLSLRGLLQGCAKVGYAFGYGLMIKGFSSLSPELALIGLAATAGSIFVLWKVDKTPSPDSELESVQQPA